MNWAVLLMAYGGPDSLEDVEPYLLDVRGGRATPSELVAEIRERYDRIGGRSPLLAVTRAQARALETVFNQPGGSGGDLYKVFVGMRHWAPYIRDAVAELRAAGFARVVALSMTPFASKMSTGAYRAKLEQAIAESGGAETFEARVIDHWYDHPGFVQAVAGRVRAALNRFSAEEQGCVPVVFTAHSLPEAIMSQGDPYEQQFRHLASLVAQALGLDASCWRACYQSAGAQNTRWLGPALEDCLAELAREGERNVLVAPIGFVADHVEVLFDIDIEARALAEQSGLRLERTDSLNDTPEFIQALAEIVRREAQKEAGTQ